MFGFWQSIVIAITAMLVALGIGLASVQPAHIVSTAPPISVTPPTPAASSTPPVVVSQKTSTSTTATPPPPKPAKKITPPIQPSPQAPVQKTLPLPAPAAPASATSTISITDQVRGAVVNIVCSTTSAGPFDSISGSGILIDSRGIILTNSHVAQFFLLHDYPTPGFTNCVIRTGSPAYPRYTAELLYMPPSWMTQNAYKIALEDPTGNGEHDYAFLRITGTVDPKVAMPVSFPFLPISVAPPATGEKTILAAYPAGFLGGITVAEALYSASAEATVGDLYTFVSNTLDLFSVGGTILSQKGSSGGAVTDDNGVLIGLIVTATEATNTADRDLRAISTPYIIRDFQNESGISLETFLSNDVALEAQSFAASTFPTLRDQLVQALEKK